MLSAHTFLLVGLSVAVVSPGQGPAFGLRHLQVGQEVPPCAALLGCDPRAEEVPSLAFQPAVPTGSGTAADPFLGVQVPGFEGIGPSPWFSKLPLVGGFPLCSNPVSVVDDGARTFARLSPRYVDLHTSSCSEGPICRLRQAPSVMPFELTQGLIHLDSSTFVELSFDLRVILNSDADCAACGAGQPIPLLNVSLQEHDPASGSTLVGHDFHFDSEDHAQFGLADWRRMRMVVPRTTLDCLLSLHFSLGASDGNAANGLPIGVYSATVDVDNVGLRAVSGSLESSCSSPLSLCSYLVFVTFPMGLTEVPLLAGPFDPLAALACGQRACLADLDGDGAVGGVDLSLLLGWWGTVANPDQGAADFDGDGEVGASDLAVLLGSYGPCP